VGGKKQHFEKTKRQGQAGLKIPRYRFGEAICIGERDKGMLENEKKGGKITKIDHRRVGLNVEKIAGGWKEKRK